MTAKKLETEVSSILPPFLIRDRMKITIKNKYCDIWDNVCCLFPVIHESVLIEILFRICLFPECQEIAIVFKSGPEPEPHPRFQVVKG